MSVFIIEINFNSPQTETLKSRKCKKYIGIDQSQTGVWYAPISTKMSQPQPQPQPNSTPTRVGVDRLLVGPPTPHHPT